MINFTKAGDGHPVILVHGIAASARAWDDIAPELIRSGYQVITLDLPGHGFSVKPQDYNEYNIERFYQIFEEWLNTLDLHEPPVMIAHSMGSYFALRYALNATQTQVKALVLIDPFVTVEQFTLMMKLFYSEKIFSPLVIKGISILPEWFYDLTLSTTNTYFRIFHGEKFSLSKAALRTMAYDYKRAHPAIFLLPFSLTDIRAQLKDITTPTLIIGGSHDQNLQPKFFEKIAAALPNADIHIIPGTHNPQHSNPRELNPLMFEFVRNHSGQEKN